MAQTSSRRKKRRPHGAPGRAPRLVRRSAACACRGPAAALSELEQPALDAIGLGLVACGLLLAFVLYTGSEGGTVGGALVDTLRFLVGSVAYLVPVFVIGAGVALAARPHLRSPTRMRWGAIVLALGLTLGFAAGSLGWVRRAAGHDLFNVNEMMDRGGIVGEVPCTGRPRPFSRRAGAHLVFAFLVLGRDPAAHRPLDRGAGDGRPRPRGPPGAHRRRGVPARPRRRGPPAPAFEEPWASRRSRRFILSPTRRRRADRRGVDVMLAPEAEEDPLTRWSARSPASAPRRGPPLHAPGQRRSSVTESDGLNYKLPDPKLLRHSAKGQGPDTSNQDDIGRLLVETLGHFGIEAKMVGRSPARG